jgi:hypothetical protein
MLNFYSSLVKVTLALELSRSCELSLTLRPDQVIRPFHL